MRKHLLLIAILVSWFSTSFAFHFDSYWSGDDQDLFFNIQLDSGLVFDEDYTIFLVDDNAIGCEIGCKPLEEGSVLSSEGLALKAMSITVIVENLGTANEIEYGIISTCSYEGVDDEGYFVTRVNESTRVGLIEKLPVDLSQPPAFFWLDIQRTDGVIHFKNT